MSKQARVIKSNNNEIPQEISDLVAALRDLPVEHRSKIEPIATQVVESAKRRRRILSLVQDALSQLRLDMKYLAFDLDATRRERDDYRQRLEESR